MTSSWHTASLSELCEQMNGIWKGTKGPFVTAKVLRTTNFTKDCQLQLNDLAIIEVEKKKMDARHLQKGDIIVEKSGGGPKQPVGRVILFNIDDLDYSFCNFTSALRIKDKTILLPEYLHKYLTYLYYSGETEKYQSNLVGFRNLDFKGYVSMKIHFPSLQEQRRINSVLDAGFARIDSLSNNAAKNFQNAKDLFQAAIIQELEPKKGWNTFALKDISESIGDGLHGTPEYSDDGPCYFINGNNLNDGVITINNKTNRVSSEERDKYYIPLNNHTLLVSINGTLGKVAYYNGEDVILGKSACYITLKKGINKDFIFHILSSDIFMKYAESEYTGLTIKNVSLKSMRNFPIHFPPSEKEQLIVVDKLNSLRTKSQTLQNDFMRIRNLCDDLKHALLRKAFNGEL